LCLACSASLFPKGEVFITPCCARPICNSCISSNPRLARYNPCIACQFIGSSSSKSTTRPSALLSPNFDGAIRDEDTFVLGDSDEDED
ncbi:hypothetical protein FISHEDRAFT_20923, partial [Fistulina hepatica ATCC 64428]